MHYLSAESLSLSQSITIMEKLFEQYNGGGHMYASGATLLSLDELDSLIKDLKEASHV